MRKHFDVGNSKGHILDLEHVVQQCNDVGNHVQSGQWTRTHNYIITKSDFEH